MKMLQFASKHKPKIKGSVANQTLTGVAARSEVSVAAATFVGPDAHFVFLAGEVPLAESCCGEGERATLAVAQGDAWRVSVSARYVRVRHSFPSCAHPPQHANPGDLRGSVGGKEGIKSYGLEGGRAVRGGRPAIQ